MSPSNISLAGRDLDCPDHLDGMVPGGSREASRAIFYVCYLFCRLVKTPSDHRTSRTWADRHSWEEKSASVQAHPPKQWTGLKLRGEHANARTMSDTRSDLRFARRRQRSKNIPRGIERRFFLRVMGELGFHYTVVERALPVEQGRRGRPKPRAQWPPPGRREAAARLTPAACRWSSSCSPCAGPTRRGE